MDILNKKLYKSYDWVSRYNSIPYYYNTADNKYMYGTVRLLKSDTTYLDYIVKAGDTYDSLSLDAYNNPTYFWIICDFNRIQDPFEKPVVGTVLKIPGISSIQFED